MSQQQKPEQMQAVVPAEDAAGNLKPAFADDSLPSYDDTHRQTRVATRPGDWVAAAREEETLGTRATRQLQSTINQFTQWLRPSAPAEMPVPTQMAQALINRASLHEWLSYRDFDDERKLVYTTAADSFRVGFVLGLMPLLVAGTDIESQLEAVITNCPADTVLQIGVLCSTQTEMTVNAWLNSRVSNNPHPMLQEIALRRAEFFSAASENGGTLTFGGTNFQPRNYFYYLSVSLPYYGAPNDEAEMDIFLKNIVGLRATIEGGMKGASIPSWALDRLGFEALLNEILNPQFTSAERRARQGSNIPLPQCLVDKESRVTVKADGSIGFSRLQYGDDPDEPVENEIIATVLTMDSPPPEGWLPNTAKLLGHPLSRDDRINCPFWLHTTIMVQNADKAKDRVTMKLGTLNKQMMSDSPWYRSMMGHLYTQKDELDSLLEAARHGHTPVRVWSGIVLYNAKDRVKRETEYVANLWRKAGFRCSPERYISMPVFLAGLPLMYDPESDPPSKGLQRANTMNSFTAATMMHVQGDWSGSAPTRGGPLMVSRRGQLAVLDLFDTSSNYNFVVIAQSGSGKSFFCNELAVDFLSRNGVVRIFDVGRSYKRFASVMGGVILEFTPENPKSLNPFSGITTHGELYELMPMLKSLIRQMVFPLTTDEQMEAEFNWQYQAIEAAIIGAWETKQETTGLCDVWEWMDNQDDPRYTDLAFQLHSFAVGRYSPWFNGPREIELNNDLIIVELEDLEVDPDLQAVVMTLMIHQITKDMYLSDPERKRPKLLLVDEGWRLLGEKQSGGFISKAFRTVRKYRGCAGAITQSYADFAASAAARAALENSAWQFVLKQRPDSIDFAVSQKWISDDKMLTGMLKTVNSDTNAGFSEIFVRGENGQGVYRFITDRHSYWLYTSNPKDIAKLAELQNQGLTLLEAVDLLARQDYREQSHPFRPQPGSLREDMVARYEAQSLAETLEYV